MTAGSDEQVLRDFFETATPLIEELVTRAVQQGQRVRGLAVILERKLDGQVAGGCGSRGAVDARLRDTKGVDDIARQMIIREVQGALVTEVPVVQVLLPLRVFVAILGGRPVAPVNSPSRLARLAPAGLVLLMMAASVGTYVLHRC